MRRYALNTLPAWRTALERLRALAQLLERADVPLAASLDDLAPTQRRTLRDYRTALAGIAWSCAPSRLREGLPPERGDLDGWARAGIVDAIASRPCGRLDDDPDARAYQLGHASALAALYCRPQPQPQPQEPAPMTDPKQTDLVTIDDAARGHGLDPGALQAFVLDGDLSSVPRDKRAAIYVALCSYIGVDPIERPFLIFKDKKREVLYAARSCTSALCRSRGISRELLSVATETLAGHEIIVAKARATIVSTGRHDEATGAVPVLVEDREWDERARKMVSLGWRKPNPDEASNAVMKAETKAKRRAVLDLVGLGIPDESEVATIRDARTATLDLATGNIIEAETVEQPQRRPSASKPSPAKPAPSDEVARIKADLAKIGHVTGEKPSEAWARLAIDAGHPSAKLQGGDPVAIAHVRVRLDAELAAYLNPNVAVIAHDAFAILRARGPEEGTTLDELLDGHEIAHLPSLPAGELASMHVRLAKLCADEVES